VSREVVKCLAFTLGGTFTSLVAALVPGIPAGETHPSLVEIKNKNLYRVVKQPKEGEEVRTAISVVHLVRSSTDKNACVQAGCGAYLPCCSATPKPGDDKPVPRRPLIWRLIDFLLGVDPREGVYSDVNKDT
jgi:hypothetical protein